MESKIINWDATAKGSDLEILSVYYSFIAIVGLLSGDVGVDTLLLKVGDVSKVKEEGFREFLKMINSIKWNLKELTDDQKKVLGKIDAYLKTPIKGETQPIINGNTVTLEELRNLKDEN